jgi:hypothetical protein
MGIFRDSYTLLELFELSNATVAPPSRIANTWPAAFLTRPTDYPEFNEGLATRNFLRRASNGQHHFQPIAAPCHTILLGTERLCKLQFVLGAISSTEAPCKSAAAAGHHRVE